MTIEAPTRTLIAADVMSAPPLTVSPETSVWETWSLMTSHGVRHLLVVARGRCVGVIDDRTLFAQWPLGPVALRRQDISSIMRAPVACVLPDASLGEIARLMVVDAVDSVPVVDQSGGVLGIVTSSDILAAVAGVAVHHQA